MKPYCLVIAAVLAATFTPWATLTVAGQVAQQTAYQQVHHLQQIRRERPFHDGEVDQLVDLAANEAWEVRVRALTALRYVSSPGQKAKAARVMRVALKDGQYVVRAYAVDGLARLGGPGDIPALEVLLRDPEPVVRNRTYRAMGSLYLAAGSTKKAIAAFEAAARVPGLDSGSLASTAKDLVAGCRAGGQPEHAVQFLRRLLDKEPDNRAYMEMLAIAYAGGGRQGEALEWRRKSTIVGNPAPAVALKSLSGGEQTLAAYRGEVILLNFFASW